MLNLDYECAKVSESVKKEIMGKKGAETGIQKALGVLQEDGMYAFVIYLLSQREKGNIADILLNKSMTLLHRLSPESSEILEPEKVLETVCSNVDSLLLGSKALERMLVYARYHAKAVGG